MSLVHTPVHLIGGSGGSAFTYDQSRNGQVLSRIGVWAGPSALRGIRIWMTGSDSSVTYGTAAGTYQEFALQVGERITRLSLWGNGIGTRSGGIRFFTTTGREFFHRMTSWSLRQEYPIDVASGLCVGFIIRAGEDIDALGFMFLRSIASARMIDVSYPTLALETAGIVPVTLDSYSDSNNAATISKDWSFAGSRTVTISSSWTLTAGIEYYASVSVQAGIPIIGQVSTEFGWSVSVTGSYTSTHEESRTLSWNQSGTLQPGQWISLQATTRRGNITIPYQGTMEITLQSGTVFRYPISSLYTGVDFTSVEVTNTGSRAPSDQVDTQAADKEAQEGDPDIQPNIDVDECKLLDL